MKAVEDAAGPAALFARHRYRELAAVLHPDRNPGDARAHRAAAMLNRLHDEWKRSRRQTVTTATSAPQSRAITAERATRSHDTDFSPSACTTRTTSTLAASV